MSISSSLRYIEPYISILIIYVHVSCTTTNRTDWLWAFGQFLNHDISQVNTKPGEICNINVPPDDPFLDSNVTFLPMNRSKFVITTDADTKGVYNGNDTVHITAEASVVAHQLNDISSFINADNVYGNTMSRLDFIRSDDSSTTGRLRTSNANLLPKNTIGLTNRGGDTRADLFLAGDVRANENLGLTVVHTLWMREHNYWADHIRDSNADLSGDEVFAMARIIVEAENQKIVYDEFLPALLGENAIPTYKGYRSDVDGRLENVVSACAYRIGHSMVGSDLLKDYGNGTVDKLPLEDAFFAPVQIETGIDPFLRGLATNVCQEVDPFLVPALRNHLFSNQFDLVALNIERARDHGIPDFNSIRASIGLEAFNNFDDFMFSQELASVYSDTNQIDCWIGMNAEPRIDGLMVGETQQQVLARNFAAIRDGDVNFYKNSITDPDLLALIEETTLADVIRRNSDAPNSLDDISSNVFFVQQ